MALQESLEEGYKADYPTDDDGIRPDFSKPCITSCRRFTRTCWASRERVESRRQDPSNFIAVSAPRPLKLRRSRRRATASAAANTSAAAPAMAIQPKSQCRHQDPSNFVAAILRCPPAQAAAGPGVGDPVEGRGQSPRAHRWQINLVVLDERCAVVCRNRTAI